MRKLRLVLGLLFMIGLVGACAEKAAETPPPPPADTTMAPAPAADTTAAEAEQM